MTYLKQLSIDALRGCTKKFDLQFDPGKKITIIYGENGTGKSTICDALEFIGKGKVGSLDEKGLGVTQRFWPASGRTAVDINVILTTSNGQWQARLIKNKVQVNPEIDAPKVEVLRRRQILALMEAKPSDRFEVIRPFIDLDAIEESEKSLRDLIRSEKQTSDIAVARLTENIGIIESLWVAAQKKDRDALTWARQESSNDQTKLLATLATLEQVRKFLIAACQQKERVDSAQRVSSNFEKQLQQTLKLLQQTQTQFAIDTQQLVKLLVEAKNYFVVTSAPLSCPLCGSSEFSLDLPERIDQQLQSINTLNNAIQLHEKTEQEVQFSQKQLYIEQQQVIDAAIQVCMILTQTLFPDEIEKPIISSDLSLILHDSLMTLEDRTIVAAAIISDLQEFLVQLENAIQRRQQAQGSLKALRVAVQQYEDSLTTQQSIASILPSLERTLAIIEEERKSHTDRALTLISTRVGELYEAIHPGEGLSKVSLQLDPKKRASLDIASKIAHAGDAPPQAFLSESHLDTLGLCIFLGIAELSDAKNTVLVLDDVVASIDEPHVDRIIRMLYDEAKRFGHCTITTHYRPWKEKYRWGWLAEGECQFVELRKWSISQGMGHTRSIMRVEDLRAHLSNATPNPQVICSSAGVLLEAMLDFLTELYECSVPRRKSKLTLGDLLPAIDNKKLRPALRAERLLPSGYESKQLKDILDELERIAQVRNVVGCHFNDLSYDLLDSDAFRFGELVLELADWLVDPQRGWPRSDKSGSYWATNGETRRLHPLKRPT